MLLAGFSLSFQVRVLEPKYEGGEEHAAPMCDKQKD